MVKIVKRTKIFFINKIASKSPQKIRDYIYKCFKFTNNSVSVREKYYFQTPSTIEFNENIFINKNNRFYNGYGSTDSKIVIGNNVSIGFDNTFITTTHEIGESSQRVNYKEFINKPITIGNGVWITSRCTILPGCTIGDGVIIAAGSVVTQNCEENCLYAGIPAKKIKKLI